MNAAWVEKFVRERPAKPTLGTMIDVAVRDLPERAAIIYEDKPITYRELDEAANRVANAVIGMGIKRGDHVCVHLDNRPEFLMIFLGLLRAGAVTVPANVMYTADEMDYILSDAQAKLLFVSSNLAKKLENVVPALEDLKAVIEVGDSVLPSSMNFRDVIAKASTERPSERIDSVEMDDLAVIQYTSGTTGKPKGAMCSHGNIRAALDNTSALPLLDIEGEDKSLLVLPLFHSYALNSVAPTALSNGLTLVLINRFDANLIFEQMAKHDVNMFHGAPPMYFAFVNTPGLEKHHVRLKAAFSGAAPLPVPIMEKFKALTGAEIIEGYGLSETCPVLCTNAVGPTIKPGTVGPAIPQVQLRIVDDNDNDVTPGEVGEIVARGPNVFKGYWHKEEATREAFKGGWFHTGDLGKVDSDGYYTIVDRKKDMILVSGYNVYPIEIETVLLRNSKIKEASVIGIPDEYSGERVKAVLVLKDGEKFSEEEVIAYCREKLAAFKCPRTVSFRTELPKTNTGKILKRVLRDQEVAAGKEGGK